MTKNEMVTLSIDDDSRVFEARRMARETALSVGFGEKGSEELAIVASELASNLVKFATCGVLTISRVHRDGREGIEIRSEDRGPGIVNVEEAMSDGYSTSGSLGYGLGTVNRLMDSVDIDSKLNPEQYTRISCIRWLRKEESMTEKGPLDVGAASRPHPKMSVNGDAFVVRKWGSNLLVAVIDGLGHGQFANRASEKARHYIDTHYFMSLPDIFLGVERSCRATRGVVMAMVLIDWKSGAFSYATIGNIEIRICGNRKPLNFLTRRGIIGVKSIQPVITEHSWKPHYILALFSDGIASRWRWDDFSDVLHQSASILAGRMLHKLARETDDATIVIVKGSAP